MNAGPPSDGTINAWCTAAFNRHVTIPKTPPPWLRGPVLSVETGMLTSPNVPDIDYSLKRMGETVREVKGAFHPYMIVNRFQPDVLGLFVRYFVPASSIPAREQKFGDYGWCGIVAKL